MSDFWLLWNPLSVWGKVFFSCAMLGGGAFFGSWFTLSKHVLQSGAAQLQLLALVEKNAPELYRSFYSGDPIFHNRQRVNVKFRDFVQSRTLNETPEIAAAKRFYWTQRALTLDAAKPALHFFCLMSGGILGMIFRVALFGKP